MKEAIQEITMLRSFVNFFKPMDLFKPTFSIERGSKLPDFKLKKQDGSWVHLNQINSQWLVLFFYPQDNTPTCTKEACNLKDNYSTLKEHGVLILGVSPDDEKSHQKFIAKYNLPYDLVVDENHKLASFLGIWGQKKFMGKIYDGIHRVTLVLNSKHELHDYIYPVKSGEHADQILNCILQ